MKRLLFSIIHTLIPPQKKKKRKRKISSDQNPATSSLRFLTSSWQFSSIFKPLQNVTKSDAIILLLDGQLLKSRMIWMTACWPHISPGKVASFSLVVPVFLLSTGRYLVPELLALTNEKSRMLLPLTWLLQTVVCKHALGIKDDLGIRKFVINSEISSAHWKSKDAYEKGGNGSA